MEPGRGTNERFGSSSLLESSAPWRSHSLWCTTFEPEANEEELVDKNTTSTISRSIHNNQTNLPWNNLLGRSSRWPTGSTLRGCWGSGCTPWKCIRCEKREEGIRTTERQIGEERRKDERKLVYNILKYVFILIFFCCYFCTNFKE